MPKENKSWKSGYTSYMSGQLQQQSSSVMSIFNLSPTTLNLLRAVVRVRREDAGRVFLLEDRVPPESSRGNKHPVDSGWQNN
ncbi:rCG27036 [Rattus norvegicus]|uniref:RCG27036 n=1 Tax=Rattus norvegicus TaxID=10116 RepID=A6HMP2_RAT|nr:rCG27036 [Rattus norvegicus]